jgi:hypothetical protein
MLLKYGSLAVASLLLLFIVILAFLYMGQPESRTERNFAAFRMGAAIYVGTFLLGNNWDYRLAFLVLLIPQLMEWTRSSHKTYRLFAILSMTLILVSCWHLWIVEIPLIFNSVEDSKKFWIVLDEAANWVLFASLAYLLFVSVPVWVKEMPRILLSKTGILPSQSHEPSRPPIS